MDEQRSRNSMAEVPGETYRICWNCKTWYNEILHYCPKCGSYFYSLSLPRPPTRKVLTVDEFAVFTPNGAPMYNQCWRCGRLVWKHIEFFPYCGANVLHPPNRDTPRKTGALVGRQEPWLKCGTRKVGDGSFRSQLLSRLGNSLAADLLISDEHSASRLEIWMETSSHVTHCKTMQAIGPCSCCGVKVLYH